MASVLEYFLLALCSALFLQLLLPIEVHGSMNPPRGVLSIYVSSGNPFEDSLFPIYVTTHQPAVHSISKIWHAYGHKIQGRLVFGEDACSDVPLAQTHPVPDDDPVISWILLADDQHCNASTKIRNAAQAGYSALIIYNTLAAGNEHDTSLINVPKKDLAIYTTSITLTDGTLLHSMYSYPAGYYVELEENSLLFMDVLYSLMLICFTVSSMFIGLLAATWLYDACLCQQFLDNLTLGQQEKRLQKFLAKKTISRTWSPDGPFQNNDSCIVCLEEFSTKDQIRVLPCLHVFHTICIDLWVLKMSPCCPICKQFICTRLEELQILRDDGQELRDEAEEESIPLLPVALPAASMPSYVQPTSVQHGPYQSAQATAALDLQQQQYELLGSQSESTGRTNATARQQQQQLESLRAASQSFCDLLPPSSSNSSGLSLVKSNNNASHNHNNEIENYESN